MTIREMLPSDADSIITIYKQGVESGKATFTTAVPRACTLQQERSHHNEKSALQQRVAPTYHN